MIDPSITGAALWLILPGPEIGLVMSGFDPDFQPHLGVGAAKIPLSKAAKGSRIRVDHIAKRTVCDWQAVSCTTRGENVSITYLGDYWKRGDC